MIRKWMKVVEEIKKPYRVESIEALITGLRAIRNPDKIILDAAKALEILQKGLLQISNEERPPAFGFSTDDCSWTIGFADDVLIKARKAIR